MAPPVVAIFGPTAVGKTAVAVALAGLLAQRGERSVAVNCDSIQVYEGLGIIAGAPSAAERERLEHRLVGFLPVSEEFSAGRYAGLAHDQIDSLRREGIWPLVVGGTGLYLRAALTELDLRPPVPGPVQREIEGEIAERGPKALHAELPERFRRWVAPRDRKRVARLTGLLRSGQEPAADAHGGGELWTRSLRHPAVLAGLAMEPGPLADRISRRVDAMAAAGAAREAAVALEAGASRTARAAIGFREFGTGDLDRVKTLHRRYGRRQMTWMRRMEGVNRVDRGDRPDVEIAREILGLADRINGGGDRRSGSFSAP